MLDDLVVRSGERGFALLNELVEHEGGLIDGAGGLEEDDYRHHDADVEHDRPGVREGSRRSVEVEEGVENTDGEVGVRELVEVDVTEASVRSDELQATSKWGFVTRSGFVDRR